MGLPSFTSYPPKTYIGWANTGWHVTPWWDWHRYRGGKMRAWVWEETPMAIGSDYDGLFIYRTFEEHARHVLLEVGTGKAGGEIERS